MSPMPHFTGGETKAQKGKMQPSVQREIGMVSRSPGSQASALAVLRGLGRGADEHLQHSAGTQPPWAREKALYL